MPNLYEGPASTPELPPMADLAGVSSPQSGEAEPFCSGHRSSAKTRVELAARTQRGATMPRQPSAQWTRIGQNIWQANRDAFPAVPPMRDVPAWLTSQAMQEVVPASMSEDLLPLRFGFEPGPSLADRLQPRAERPPGRPVHEALDPPLQFPSLTDFAPSRNPPGRTHSSGSHLEDGVLPFRVPVRQTIAVFSLAGGTGRTTLAAGLARLLAGSGLRVLLADTSAFSLLPRLFGSGESRQGVVRNFFPVHGETTRMISLISLAVEPFAGDDYEQYRILQELGVHAGRVDRVIWDLGGAPLEWAAKVLGTGPQILVPLLPNANSLMQLRATERFLNQCHEEEPGTPPRYVLSQFDEQDSVHCEIRGRLQKQLGRRLLRIPMRRSPLVDEALSCGKTVLDHAPGSPLGQDLRQLAQQLHQVDDAATSRSDTPSDWFED